jgi:hypothetical protein
VRVVSVVLCLFVVPVLAHGADGVTFNRNIHPILSDKCFACHGPSEADRKGDLRLDVPDGEEGALTARGSSYVIKPGFPAESELWHRITTDDEDDLMPPAESHKARLTDDEMAQIRQWILDGGEYQPFWSFISPTRSSPPEIKNTSWGAGLIDGHVIARLEEEGLQPKVEADKRTLLRRITFDLTGLPPSLEEIEEFLGDESPKAYENLVDRLLDRDSYGEHMTRYWADLVRLSDTNGMHKDFPRDFSTYRDWLIRSFNNNFPFDEFIKYQLAGDLYDDPSQDQLVASGFNRLHMIIDRGTALPEESLHKNVLDRVEAFGTTFLGLTVQCAQCHEHKYDPISQEEFYQVYAFFNNFSGNPETVRLPERGLQPPFIHLTNPAQEKRLATLEVDESRLANIRTIIEGEQAASTSWPKKFEKVSVPWIWDDPARKSEIVEFRSALSLPAAPTMALARFTAMGAVELSVNGTDLGMAHGIDGGVAADLSRVLLAGENLISARAEKDRGFAFVLEYEVNGVAKTFTSSTDWEHRLGATSVWKQTTEVHTPAHKSEWTEKARPANIAALAREIDSIVSEKKAFLNTITAAMVMDELDPPRPANFLIRGAYDAPGDPVERNTPAFLPSLKAKEGMYTRMDLAEWLVAPEHPLTARVAVNRIWQQFFGVGLVKTAEDFGAQGERPSHPELLDDLAVSFVESGWNLKQLVREIVFSNTYRQGSDAKPEEFRRDPENRLLARGSRYRMDAEMIRDQILAVSGQLNHTMYGKSVKPPQPPGLWEMVSMAEPKTYIADKDDNIYRRSLYTYWRRGMPPPQMTIMNAPSREFCLARRERTNTPLQALLMMNEQEYFKAAKACATSTLQSGKTGEEGLSCIYERITSHRPTPERLNLMNETLLGFKDIYGSDQALAASLTSELNDAEADERVELAAWTMLTHSLLNLELAKVRR